MFGDKIDRTGLQLGQDFSDVLADNADHDELHAADRHQADHQRGIARNRFSRGPGFPRIESPNRNATVASSTPSRLATRNGATENDVSPSIESPTSRPGLK